MTDVDWHALALPHHPSPAATVAVFRDAAEYYAREADKALSGLCLNLGWNMREAAECLSRCAETLEELAVSRLQPSEVDRKLFNAAEEAVTRLAFWLTKHDHLDAYRRELARIREQGLYRVGEAQVDEDATALSVMALSIAHDDADSKEIPPSSPRYLVAELAPTIWRVPFELPCQQLDRAFEIFAQRAALHVAIYGEPRPLVLLDRKTQRVMASTGR